MLRLSGTNADRSGRTQRSPALVGYQASIALITFMMAAPVLADRTTVLTWPETVTLRGNPDSTWVVNTSRKVPGEARAVYRCSVEVKSQITSGSGNLTIRLVADEDQSISYQGIAGVSPTPLDFTTHSTVFIAHGRTVELQAYYRLNRASGTASFRNLKLEKLTGKDAAEALKSFAVPPVYFSLPVYCYSDETKLEWGYRINARLNPDLPQVAKLELRCDGQSFSSRASPAGDQWLVDVADVTLAHGTHTLHARALDKDGKVLAEESTQLRSIERPQRRNYLPVQKAFVDERNNLIVDGKPVFPIGIYHVYDREQMRQIREQGFNCIQVWGESIEHFQQLLDWAHAEGLMSFTVNKMVSDEYLTKMVNSFKGHPAHLMWDLVDEPAIRNILPEKVQPKANLVRRLDPDHPIKISFADPERAVRYKNCLDIVAAHTYPMPNGRITKVRRFMQALAMTFGDAVPRHFTPQTWMNFTDMRHREQTFAQTRAMTYLAIIHGAKGLYYYSFIDHGAWYLRQHPRLWSTFKGLTWEIESLAGVILEGSKVESVKISDTSIDFATWEYNGDRYLIAVNTTEQAVTAQITASGSFQVVRLFTDDRPLQAQERFTQEFSPLETHLIHLKSGSE